MAVPKFLQITQQLASGCFRLQAVETALNLSWLAVSALLVAGCAFANRRRMLRVPLGSALACSLLLAVVLFPAISMTDDLQRVNLEAEAGLRTAMTVLQSLIAEPEVHLAALLVLALGALSLLLLARLSTASSRQDRLPARVLWFRPAAIRPPTAHLLAQ